MLAAFSSVLCQDYLFGVFLLYSCFSNIEIRALGGQSIMDSVLLYVFLSGPAFTALAVYHWHAEKTKLLPTRCFLDGRLKSEDTFQL